MENNSIYEKERIKKEYERRLVTEKQEVLDSIEDRLPGKAKHAFKSYLRVQAEINTQVSSDFQNHPFISIFEL